MSVDSSNIDAACPELAEGVAWATDFAYQIGNSFGYSVHNRMSRQALTKLVKIDPDARVAIHVCPPYSFRPLKGRVNCLFCAWETTELPPMAEAGARMADAIFVPGRFLVPVFARYAPTYYVPLGVTPDYKWIARTRPPRGRPFRWLWVGAPNVRKGWEVVTRVAQTLARARKKLHVPRFEVYLKTSAPGPQQWRQIGPLVFDCRVLPQEQLVQLYWASHAFVMPSFGEGFGLTSAEAARTGLPVVYTPGTAMDDFLDASSAYPVDVDRNYAVEFQRLWGDGEEAEKFTASATVPRPESVLRNMVDVMRNYPKALKKAKRAARRIAAEFTWERTARCLLEGVTKCLIS